MTKQPSKLNEVDFTTSSICQSVASLASYPTK